jgi:hypothetical protein
MKKLIGLSFLAVGLLVIGSQSSYAAIPRTPKEVYVSAYTTGALLVSPAVSTNAVAAAAFSPGAVYEVNLSSGASGEYELMVDTANCTGITATMAASALTSPSNFLGVRLFYASTTANTDIKFDPPLVFEHGLCIVDSAVTGSAAITYELGRGLSGN